jgi:hypothetical protein
VNESTNQSGSSCFKDIISFNKFEASLSGSLPGIDRAILLAF